MQLCRVEVLRLIDLMLDLMDRMPTHEKLFYTLDDLLTRARIAATITNCEEINFRLKINEALN